MTESSAHNDVSADSARAALQKLFNEVGGVWRAFEHDIRAAISNTNYACVELRLGEAMEALAMPDVTKSQPKWRHLKRGSIVTEIARGFAQVAHHPIEEMTCVVIYRHDDDGRYWVRNAVEFDDGRFEAYPLSSTKREGGDND